MARSELARRRPAVDGGRIDQVGAVIDCHMHGANGFFLVGTESHPATDGPGAEGGP
jgi:hypothetical protein